MRRAALLILITIFLLPSLARSEIVLKAEVDKLKLSTDENLVYKIIMDSSERNFPSPELPKLEGFTILSQVQTSEISLNKGKLETSAIYVLMLRPLKTGKIKIEPAVIKIKDKAYSSEAFEIVVTQGKRRLDFNPDPASPVPGKSLPASKEPKYLL